MQGEGVKCSLMPAMERIGVVRTDFAESSMVRLWRAIVRSATDALEAFALFIYPDQ
jgi:hypothetical protein